MVTTGEEGYVKSCRAIVGATKKMAEGVRQIPELELLGRPDVCVVALACTKESGLNTYCLGDAMRMERGWDLASLQNPPGLHLAVTLPSAPNADAFIEDLRHCIELMKAGKTFSGGNAAMYGSALVVPQKLLDESAAVYLDISMEASPKAQAPVSE
eukprot:Hpha_TRINITY_DN16620_c0_g1::TRINITY_DN16620_c0_g1_i2::g.179087::m.179087/K01634/SGPL1, DPL1; sphinganine-1-phosphate aldolase